MARIPTRQLFRFRRTIKTTYLSSSPFSSSPSPSTIFREDRTISLIKSCQNIKQIFQIQAHLITSGLFFNNSFWTIRVLKHASDFGNIDYVSFVFKCIDNPGTFCVNAVINAYSNSCVPNQALDFYFQMVRDGFVPNSYSFVPLLGACAKSSCVGSGRMCHGLAVKNGVDLVLPVQNCLIHMYGCLGSMSCARELFVEMSQRDLVSWNLIVDAYVRMGNMRIAHDLFDVMTEKNVVSWNIMIAGYSKSGNPGCSLKLCRDMVKSGWKGSNTTMVSVLTACGRSARLKEGQSVHGFIIRTSVKSNVILDTSLIDMYSKCQKVDVAQRVFDRMAVRNLVCWNAMILGHCIHGKPESGLKLFTALVDEIGAERERIYPDEITFIGVLCACARAELLTAGRSYYKQMIDFYKIKPNFAHYWCLANVYAGVGFVEEAEEILRKMPEDDEHLSSESLVWVNILSSCRFKGDVALGERIAKSLIDVEPDAFSHYQLLLNVYASAGRWDDAALVKELMKERMMGRMPGCGLLDLKEIVYKLKLRPLWGEGKEVNMRISSLVNAVSEHQPLHEKEIGNEC